MPIFIVGCGRSGTSLLRRFLNQHPRSGSRSSRFSLSTTFRCRRAYRSSACWACSCASLNWRNGNPSDTGGRAGQSQLGRSYRSSASAVPCTSWQAPLGQKTPRFVRHLPLLQAHFPDARFIHLVRDPRAVAASLIRSNVHRSTAYYAARRWRMDVDFGLAFEKSAPETVLRLAYEELVAGPENTLRRVCQFCGLEFDPTMLTSPKGEGAEYSSFYTQIHANVDRPATQDFVDRWPGNCRSSRWR